MVTTSALIEKAPNFEFSPHDVKRQELETVVSCHFAAFLRQAIRHLGNAADAEDAVQDALLSAFRHIAQFRDHAQMSTWLTRIVINSARTHLRRRSRENNISIDEHPEQGEAFPLLERLLDRGLSPEEAFRRSNLTFHATELAQKLSPDLREAFQLHDLEGQSIREMTNTLGASTSAVKTRVSRARTRIRHLARAL